MPSALFGDFSRASRYGKLSPSNSDCLSCRAGDSKYRCCGLPKPPSNGTTLDHIASANGRWMVRGTWVMVSGVQCLGCMKAVGVAQADSSLCSLDSLCALESREVIDAFMVCCGAGGVTYPSICDWSRSAASAPARSTTLHTPVHATHAHTRTHTHIHTYTRGGHRMDAY